MVQCIGKLIYHVIESAKCHFYAETTRLCFICKMISRYLADVINPIDTKGHIFGAAFINYGTYDIISRCDMNGS